MGTVFVCQLSSSLLLAPPSLLPSWFLAVVLLLLLTHVMATAKRLLHSKTQCTMIHPRLPTLVAMQRLVTMTRVSMTSQPSTLTMVVKVAVTWMSNQMTMMKMNEDEEEEEEDDEEDESDDE